MSSDLEKQKTFEERMKSRIRDSIGELMTDEELSRIVIKATEEIFFQPIKLQDGYHTKEIPPFAHTIVKELLTETVRELIKKYFDDNKEGITEVIKEIIKEGLGGAVLSAISSKFDWDLQNFGNNLMQTIQNQ